MSLQVHSLSLEMPWQFRDVPEDWKKVYVSPAFRNGEKKDSENYKTGQPHLSSWDTNGVNDLRNHFQIHEGEGGHCKQSVQIYEG